METKRCKSLENIIFYLGRKEKKETLTEGINTEDERSLGLSASLDNVLRRRLENYNLGIEETQGDGNCFFRAVSRMVYASDEYHLHVRSQAITYLSEHRDEFEGFITNKYNNSINSYIQSMSQDGHWADNLIIRATADALNIEIHIISSAQETPTIIFRPITDNPTQTIFLGHITHLHYVSTRSLSEPQVMRYRGCTKDGVRLTKTYIIDNILTWLFLTISRFQEIREFLDNIQHLKNIKQILDSYRIFQRGNAADSKKGWFEFVTHKKPHIYREFISFNEMTDADVMSKIIESKYLGEVSNVI